MPTIRVKAQFQKGKIFCAKTYMACSLSEEQALWFTMRGAGKDARILFKIHLSAGKTCKRGKRLKHVSTISEEQEVSFIPGTRFRIESIRDDMEGTSIRPYIIVLFVKGEEDSDSSWSKDVQEIDWI